MATIQSTVSFDDGLYHPSMPTPTMAYIPDVTATIPTATTSPSISTLVPVPLIPSSSVQPYSDNSSSTQNMQTGVQVAISSSFASILLPSTPSAKTSQVTQPDSPHNSTPLILGVFVFLSLFLGTSFFLAYWNRHNFRRWRDRRRDRNMGTFETVPTKFRQGARGLEIGWPKRGEIEEKEEMLYNRDRNDCTPSDPFARSIPHRSVIQSYFASYNPLSRNPVEHIDNERGWHWGTRKSKASQISIVSGLGKGHHRAKSTTTHGSNSQEYIKEEFPSPSEYTASVPAGPISGGKRDDFFIYNQKYDELDEEFDEYTVENRKSTSQEDEPNLGAASLKKATFTPGGAFYLLERLKESISSRSGRRTPRASRGRDAKGLDRGRWNEIGEWEEDNERGGSDHERTITLNAQEPWKQLWIPLPDVPLLAWDITSSPAKQRFRGHSSQSTDEEETSALESPVRRTTRGWILSDQVQPPASFTAAIPSASTEKLREKQSSGRSPAEDRLAIRNSLSLYPSQVLSPEFQPDLFFTGASPPSQRISKSTTESVAANALSGSSDQISSLASIAQRIFSSGEHDSGTAPKSNKMVKANSDPLTQDGYTSLPKTRSDRRKRREKSESIPGIDFPPAPEPQLAFKQGESKIKGKQVKENQATSTSPLRLVFPGGFVGRSPTKKLKKPTHIGASARINPQLGRQ